MTATTTIKVPKDLREQIAKRAEKEGITLAGAIRQALAAAETQEFWEAVRVQNAQADQDDLGEVGLGDGLADSGDDALGSDGW